MNLEALALRRAEEQIASTDLRRPEKREPPRLIRTDLLPLSCVCGRCPTCRKREWMRAWRGGYLVHRVCVECGRKVRADNATDWCGHCKQARPGKFKRYLRAWLRDGAGI